MRFFNELRRRNVIRMAALYVGAAWLISEVAERVITLADLPASVGIWLLTILAIGFPIAVIISWFYEVTPQGIAAEKDLPAGDRQAHLTDRRVDFIIIGVLAAAVLLFAYEKWWPDQPAERSIAVLAFANTSNDPDQEYFSDGISEEILNILAQFRQLKVSARTSSFYFKSKDVPIAEIAEKLHVRHVLEGSVRRMGNRVRISAQLIDSRDSTHKWSEVFERELAKDNLFLIQAEIAHAIAGRLNTTLTEGDEQRLAKAPTAIPKAHEAYLIGLRNFHGGVGTYAKAVSQFARAIELDPEYAAPYAGLVEACLQYHQSSAGKIAPECPQWDPEKIGSWDEVPKWDRYFRRLEPLARKAIELDPGLGEAWIALGVSLSGPWNSINPETVDEARAALERGVELSPSYTLGYARLAMFLRGEPRGATIEEWVAACKAKPWAAVLAKGLEKDPLSLELHRLGILPQYKESRESSIAHADKMVEIAPYTLNANVMRGAVALEEEGRVDEAVRWWNKAATLDWARWLNIGLPHGLVLLGDYDAAITDVETAISLVEASAAEAQRSGDSWGFADVSFLKVIKGAAHLYAGQFDEAEAIFEALNNNIETHPAHRWWSRERLVGIAYVRGGPHAVIEKYRELELTVGTPPEERCFQQKPGDESEYCESFLVPMMRATGSPDWGKSIVKAAQDELDVELPDCYLRFSPSELTGLAVAGRNEEAVQYFLSTIAAGSLGGYTHPGRDWQWFAYYEPALHVVRQDPRFQAAVADIEADLVQQRANVETMRESGEIRTLGELYPDKPDGL